MAFTTSARFPDYYDYVPTSSRFNASGTLAEKVPTNNKQRVSLVPHKCDEECLLSTCKYIRDLQSEALKRHLSSKRHSLDPSSMNNGCKKPLEKQSPCLNSSQNEGLGNKENVFSPERKVSSNIPRFKKGVTEGQAPSFMTRSQNIHNCIDKDELSPSVSNFNRNSVKRKSVKPVKKKEANAGHMNKEESSENDPPAIEEPTSNLKRLKPFNMSYTVLPKIEEQPNQTKRDDKKSHIAQGAVPKANITINNIRGTGSKPPPLKRYDSNEDNSKYCTKHPIILRGNLDLENPTKSKLFNKANELMKELSSRLQGKKYYEVALNEDQNPTKKNEETEEKIRSHDISSLDDCNLVLLVNEEYIDDNFDSYVTGVNETKVYQHVYQNKELYEISKNLVDVYLESQPTVEKTKNAKTRKTIRRKARKTTVASSQDILSEIRAIVKAAIVDLKGEFQKQIYETTNDKLDRLTLELKDAVSKANDDIGDVCERSTTNLIARLENIALRHQNGLNTIE